MLLALINIGGCDKTSLSSTPKNLPSFELTLLDGSKFNESQLKGNVAIINFWATTCSICVEEMPKMIQVFEDFKKQEFKFLLLEFQLNSTQASTNSNIFFYFVVKFSLY